MTTYLMPYESPMKTYSGIWEYVYDTDIKSPRYYHKDCDQLCDPITGICPRCNQAIDDMITGRYHQMKGE